MRASGPILDQGAGLGHEAVLRVRGSVGTRVPMSYPCFGTGLVTEMGALNYVYRFSGRNGLGGADSAVRESDSPDGAGQGMRPRLEGESESSGQRVLFDRGKSHVQGALQAG